MRSPFPSRRETRSNVQRLPPKPSITIRKGRAAIGTGSLPPPTTGVQILAPRRGPSFSRERAGGCPEDPGAGLITFSRHSSPQENVQDENERNMPTAAVSVWQGGRQVGSWSLAAGFPRPVSFLRPAARIIKSCCDPNASINLLRFSSFSLATIVTRGLIFRRTSRAVFDCWILPAMKIGKP